MKNQSNKIPLNAQPFLILNTVQKGGGTFAAMVR